MEIQVGDIYSGSGGIMPSKNFSDDGEMLPPASRPWIPVRASMTADGATRYHRAMGVMDFTKLFCEAKHSRDPEK